MKKIFTVILLTLAMNFLAVAGAVGWLFQSGKVDKTKLKEIKEIVMRGPATQPSTSAPAPATRKSLLNFDDLLSKGTDHSSSDQVDIVQRAFNDQMLELDRRQSELADLKRQVDLANQKLAGDRQQFEKDKQTLASREQEADRLQTDKGFQDSLALYNAMPSKQVKTIFMTLSEQTVQQYLEAMQPRTATKIIKEFKSPQETDFIQKVLERMRLAQATTASEKQQ